MTSHCEILPIDGLEGLPLDDMWELFNEYYTGVSRDVFERDLSEKHQALLLRRSEKLVGFTSQRFETIQGHRVTYSGDVIIAPEARDAGTALFFQQWARAVWRRFDWWCALSSGPRTFRIAPTFFHRVTPGPELHETEQETALRRTFAESVYGAAYDHNRGIVRLADPYTLRDTEPPTRKEYPLESYFRTANPEWQRGDELVSLVSLHEDNWKAAALRMLRWKKTHA